MTFTIQEVPEWDEFKEFENEFKMYDVAFPDILAEQMFADDLIRQEIKVEDPYDISSQYQTNTLSVNTNTQYDSYNQYVASPEMLRDVVSPPTTYDYSSCDSSNTMETSQQLLQQTNDYMNFLNRPQQSLSPFQVVPQTNYYVTEYSGRRRLRDDQLTPEEFEKRRNRRERNKQAALRCRTRRRERIEALEQEVEEIDAQNKKVELDIMQLRSQLAELKEVLAGHTCCKIEAPSEKSEPLGEKNWTIE